MSNIKLMEERAWQAYELPVVNTDGNILGLLRPCLTVDYYQALLGQHANVQGFGVSDPRGYDENGE